MKRIGLVLTLAVVIFLPQAGAQEGITAYSAMIDADVPVKVLKVSVTPMSQQKICTLRSGTYCGPSSEDASEMLMFLP